MPVRPSCSLREPTLYHTCRVTTGAWWSSSTTTVSPLVRVSCVTFQSSSSPRTGCAHHTGASARSRLQAAVHFRICSMGDTSCRLTVVNDGLQRSASDARGLLVRVRTGYGQVNIPTSLW